MQFDFSDQVVLVTGGARGIGRVICQMFAAAGARVVFSYRSNETGAQEVLNEMTGTGHFALRADVANPAALEGMIDEIVDRSQRIDVLVNNAGVFRDASVQQDSFEAWQETWLSTLKVNLIGPANLIYLVARQMKRQGTGGRIVNVSSRGAFRGEPKAPAYGASKAGMNAMGQSLAQALAPDNIFIHTVAPGFVETAMAARALDGPAGDDIRNQSPLGRVAKAEEVARTVLFCASPGTEFLTGCIIDVNGASYLRQ